MSSQRSHIPELLNVTFGWVANAEGKINTRDPDPAINTYQYFFLLGLKLLLVYLLSHLIWCVISEKIKSDHDRRYKKVFQIVASYSLTDSELEKLLTVENCPTWRSPSAFGEAAKPSLYK